MRCPLDDEERETYLRRNEQTARSLEDGRTGFLADGENGFAERVVELLRDPVRARQLGAEGARRVTERFLVPRLSPYRLAPLRELAGAAGSAE